MCGAAPTCNRDYFCNALKVILARQASHKRLHRVTGGPDRGNSWEITDGDDGYSALHDILSLISAIGVLHDGDDTVVCDSAASLYLKGVHQTNKNTRKVAPHVQTTADYIIKQGSVLLNPRWNNCVSLCRSWLQADGGATGKGVRSPLPNDMSVHVCACVRMMQVGE